MATHNKRNPNPDDPSFLPEDIIYSIFLWLPVKALLRFKSVCKSLLSLISSRDFIKTHLSISTNDPRFTRHRLLLGHWGRTQLDCWTCSVYSLLNYEPVPKIIWVDYPDCIESIVDYCHGLVCFRSYDNYIFLWNPSTRESRKLPELLDIIFEDRNPNYGFGYDEFNDDFKVFAICGYKVSVYSSKYNCWRMVGDYPFEKVVGPSWGKFADGAIHWFVEFDILIREDIHNPEWLSKFFIVSLDVNTETYRKLLLPKSVELTRQATFCTFQKSLALLYQLQNKHGVDLWVIEDCGVEERWKKLFTIPYTNLLKKSSLLYPVCIYETDGFMLKSDLKSDSTIMLYNSRDKTFKYPLQLSFGDSQSVYMHTYVESLVSPHV